MTRRQLEILNDLLILCGPPTQGAKTSLNRDDIVAQASEGPAIISTAILKRKRERETPVCTRTHTVSHFRLFGRSRASL